MRRRLERHRVGQVQAGELVPIGAVGYRQVVQGPVVQGPVVFELQGADRVGDSLDGVGDRVGLVVHGVDRPGAGAVVLGVADAVQQRVAHLHVALARSILARSTAPRQEIPGLHAGEQVQVLLDAAVPVRASGPGSAKVPR